MTKSEIYNCLYDYISVQDEADSLKKIITKGELYNSPSLPIFKITNLAIKIRSDLCDEAASKIGKNNIVNLMRKIIKEANKLPREDMHGSFKINEFQCVCDGFRFLRTKTYFDIPSAPECNGNINSLMRIIDNASNFVNELPIPNIIDIKTMVKLQRNNCPKNPKFQFDFGEGKPMVNSKYLMEILENIPDVRFFWNETTTAPIYIKSNDSDVDMVLMPIRKQI